jgi:rare lipoprotein A (peptidoglycan hydrolase)
MHITSRSLAVLALAAVRGPVQSGRTLDLSPAAARALGMGPKGLAEVHAQVVGTAPQRAKS